MNILSFVWKKNRRNLFHDWYNMSPLYTIYYMRFPVPEHQNQTKQICISAAPGRSSTHTGVEIDICTFQTGCQLSSAALGMSLGLCFLTQYGPVTMIVPASGHQVRCIPWVQMSTFNKEIGFLCGLKLFALNIFCGEYLQSSLHLMLQIWWKPLLWKMCQ